MCYSIKKGTLRGIVICRRTLINASSLWRWIRSSANGSRLSSIICFKVNLCGSMICEDCYLILLKGCLHSVCVNWRRKRSLSESFIRKFRRRWNTPSRNTVRACHRFWKPYISGEWPMLSESGSKRRKANKQKRTSIQHHASPSHSKLSHNISSAYRK